MGQLMYDLLMQILGAVILAQTIVVSVAPKLFPCMQSITEQRAPMKLDKMDFLKGREAFLNLISSVEKDSVIPLLKWIHYSSEDLIKDANRCNEADKTVGQIRLDIRSLVSLSAVLPSEVVLPLEHNKKQLKIENCAFSTAVHVDGFLYNDEDVDELCDSGQMSRNYCVDCGSHQVAPLTFISHSTSVTQMKCIFRYLLPDLSGKIVVDVGSRLGSVLYGAYLYSNASSIIGCEMNDELCRIQQNIIEKYNFQDRIKVICADIMMQEDLLKTADVIILNNVFEYFLPDDDQRRIWQFLRSTIVHSGTLVVLSPSIEDTLEPLNTEIDFTKWLRKENTADRLAEANWNLFGSDESDDSDLHDLHLYSVL